jgi:hypothetical protein
MNRHERRAKTAMARSQKLVDDYVRHLPEVGPECMNGPGIFHMVMYHDDWCGMYKGEGCNCNPGIRFFVDPKRS